MKPVALYAQLPQTLKNEIIQRSPKATLDVNPEAQNIQKPETRKTNSKGDGPVGSGVSYFFGPVPYKNHYEIRALLIRPRQLASLFVE